MMMGKKGYVGVEKIQNIDDISGALRSLIK